MEESKSYSMEKLTESNYRSWSQIIEAHLDDQDLWDLVNGTEKKPRPPGTSTTSAEAPEDSTLTMEDAAQNS